MVGFEYRKAGRERRRMFRETSEEEDAHGN